MTKKIPESKRPQITGKGKKAGYLLLYHFISASEQFGNLSAQATKLLMEIARRYRGHNNGDLAIPWSELQKRGWSSQWTVRRARDELVEAAFIVISKHGGNRKPHLYAITFAPVSAETVKKKMLEIAATNAPTHAWKYQKPRIKTQKRRCCSGSDAPRNVATMATLESENEGWSATTASLKRKSTK